MKTLDAPALDTAMPEALVNLIAGTDIHHLDPDSLLTNTTANLGRAFVGQYDDAKYKELKASIRQIGVTSPIIAVLNADGLPVVQIGDRRLHAVKELREENEKDSRFYNIPVIILDSVTPLDLLRAATSENSTGKGLSCLDQAVAAERFAGAGLKGAEIAKELGFKSKGTISKLKALRTLPESLQLAAHEGRLDLELAYELSKKPAEVQNAWLNQGSAEPAENAEGTENAAGSEGAEGVAPNGETPKLKKGKAKTAKAKLTRASIKSAKVGKTGKVSTGPQPRSRDDIHAFFSAIARDKDARPNLKALGKIVVAFMDSDKGKVETVRDKVEELIKRESSKAAN